MAFGGNILDMLIVGKADHQSFYSEGLRAGQTAQKGINKGMASAAGAADNSIVPMNKQYRDLAVGAKRAEDATMSFADSLKIVGRRLVIYTVAVQAINALTNSITASVGAMKEFETEMLKVTKVMSISKEEALSLGKEIMKSADDYAVSVGTASKAAQVWAQQGFSATETARLTAESLKLTKISTLDAAEATEVLTAIMQQFNIPVNKLSVSIDVMNEVADQFAVTEEDMAEALRRGGSAAVAAGVNFEQYLAMVTAAQEQTRLGGKIIGNALKSISAKVYRPKAIDVLEQIAEVQVSLGDGKLRPVFNILSDLASKWDEFTDIQRQNISNTVAGIHQYNVFNALLQNFAKTQEVLSAATGASGSAQRELNKVTTDLTSKWERLKNSLYEFAVSVGESGLLTIIKSMVDGLTALTKTITALDVDKLLLITSVGGLAVRFGGRFLAPVTKATPAAYGSLAPKQSGSFFQAVAFERSAMAKQGAHGNIYSATRGSSGISGVRKVSSYAGGNIIFNGAEHVSSAGGIVDAVTTRKLGLAKFDSAAAGKGADITSLIRTSDIQAAYKVVGIKKGILSALDDESMAVIKVNKQLQSYQKRITDGYSEIESLTKLAVKKEEQIASYQDRVAYIKSKPMRTFREESQIKEDMGRAITRKKELEAGNLRTAVLNKQIPILEQEQSSIKEKITNETVKNTQKRVKNEFRLAEKESVAANKAVTEQHKFEDQRIREQFKAAKMNASFMADRQVAVNRASVATLPYTPSPYSFQGMAYNATNRLDKSIGYRPSNTYSGRFERRFGSSVAGGLGGVGGFLGRHPMYGVGQLAGWTGRTAGNVVGGAASRVGSVLGRGAGAVGASAREFSKFNLRGGLNKLGIEGVGLRRQVSSPGLAIGGTIAAFTAAEKITDYANESAPELKVLGTAATAAATAFSLTLNPAIGLLAGAAVLAGDQIIKMIDKREKVDTTVYDVGKKKAKEIQIKRSKDIQEAIAGVTGGKVFNEVLRMTDKKKRDKQLMEFFSYKADELFGARGEKVGLNLGDEKTLLGAETGAAVALESLRTSFIKQAMVSIGGSAETAIKRRDIADLEEAALKFENAAKSLDRSLDAESSYLDAISNAIETASDEGLRDLFARTQEAMNRTSGMTVEQINNQIVALRNYDRFISKPESIATGVDKSVITDFGKLTGDPRLSDIVEVMSAIKSNASDNTIKDLLGYLEKAGAEASNLFFYTDNEKEALTTNAQRMEYMVELAKRLTDEARKKLETDKSVLKTNELNKAAEFERAKIQIEMRQTIEGTAQEIDRSLAQHNQALEQEYEQIALKRQSIELDKQSIGIRRDYGEIGDNILKAEAERQSAIHGLNIAQKNADQNSRQELDNIQAKLGFENEVLKNLNRQKQAIDPAFARLLDPAINAKGAEIAKLEGEKILAIEKQKANLVLNTGRIMLTIEQHALAIAKAREESMHKMMSEAEQFADMSNKERAETVRNLRFIQAYTKATPEQKRLLVAGAAGKEKSLLSTIRSFGSVVPGAGAAELPLVERLGGFRAGELANRAAQNVEGLRNSVGNAVSNVTNNTPTVIFNVNGVENLTGYLKADILISLFRNAADNLPVGMKAPFISIADALKNSTTQ